MQCSAVLRKASNSGIGIQCLLERFWSDMKREVRTIFWRGSAGLSRAYCGTRILPPPYQYVPTHIVCRFRLSVYAAFPHEIMPLRPWSFTGGWICGVCGRPPYPHPLDVSTHIVCPFGLSASWDYRGYNWLFDLQKYSILDPPILFSVYGIAHLHRSTQSICYGYICYFLRYLGANFKLPGLNVSWSIV
jgi:hypothetical protein